MPAPIDTQMRLDELKTLLGQKHVSHETKVIGSILMEVCERLERLTKHDQSQDELLRPEAHRRI